MNSIKKGIVYSAVALVCVLFTLGYGHLDSYADINGNESRLIGVASSTFYYQGAYYRVKQAYINQLINMLDSSEVMEEAGVRVKNISRWDIHIRHIQRQKM